MLGSICQKHQGSIYKNQKVFKKENAVKTY